jgi:hypothetical protein
MFLSVSLLVNSSCMKELELASPAPFNDSHVALTLVASPSRSVACLPRGMADYRHDSAEYGGLNLLTRKKLLRTEIFKYCICLCLNIDGVQSFFLMWDISFFYFHQVYGLDLSVTLTVLVWLTCRKMHLKVLGNLNLLVPIYRTNLKTIIFYCFSYRVWRDTRQRSPLS